MDFPKIGGLWADWVSRLSEPELLDFATKLFLRPRHCPSRQEEVDDDKVAVCDDVNDGSDALNGKKRNMDNSTGGRSPKKTKTVDDELDHKGFARAENELVMKATGVSEPKVVEALTAARGNTTDAFTGTQ